MALVGLLASQVDVHDGCARLVGAARLSGHLFRRDRHFVVLGVGQDAVECAGDNRLHCLVFPGRAFEFNAVNPNSSPRVAGELVRRRCPSHYKPGKMAQDDMRVGQGRGETFR